MKRTHNSNCTLSRNGFTPYKRCETCELRTVQCTGLQYNAFTIAVSFLLLLFLVVSDPFWVRVIIALIVSLIVAMGYQVMQNTDELAIASQENLRLSQALKKHTQNLQFEVQKQTQQIQSMAIHDTLTGLFNRYEFERQLFEVIEANKKSYVPHVLGYMDLDQFKIVNDTSGHVAGDALLKQLSSMMRHRLDEEHMIARLGGDEFALIFKNCTLPQATALSQEILETISAFRFNWDDKLFGLSASMGLVVVHEACHDINTLMVSADVACYTAKEHGRNRIYALQELDIELAHHRNDLEWLDEIHKALGEDRFVLYGQAIMPLQTNPDIPHFELLVRMKNQQCDIVQPMAFIPAAERYNIMHLIDEWVIDHAFEMLRTLLDEGNRCRFSINLSGQSLGSEGLTEHIHKAFLRTEIPHELVCFEITETAAISNLGKALQFIKEFRSLGCFFSLDDFGSGMSSFAYLKNIPVDYLKIDGQFVRDITTNPIHAKMVHSIGEIAQVMGIKTICEFVEDAPTRDMLIEMGMDYGQGYFFCKPNDVKTCIKEVFDA